VTDPSIHHLDQSTIKSTNVRVRRSKPACTHVPLTELINSAHPVRANEVLIEPTNPRVQVPMQLSYFSLSLSHSTIFISHFAAMNSVILLHWAQPFSTVKPAILPEGTQLFCHIVSKFSLSHFVAMNSSIFATMLNHFMNLLQWTLWYCSFILWFCQPFLLHYTQLFVYSVHHFLIAIVLCHSFYYSAQSFFDCYNAQLCFDYYKAQSFLFDTSISPSSLLQLSHSALLQCSCYSMD
jgi:hypothetical protein